MASFSKKLSKSFCEVIPEVVRSGDKYLLGDNLSRGNESSAEEFSWPLNEPTGVYNKYTARFKYNISYNSKTAIA